MKRIYFIERRSYTLDKNEPVSSDYKSIWNHMAYASFELALKDLEDIKDLRRVKYKYIPEVEDVREYRGERKWDSLNIREEFEIVSYPVCEGADNE